MQVFERKDGLDLVEHYEYFLMNYCWTQCSLPEQIGDWNLLGGNFWIDEDGPRCVSAVYQTCTGEQAKVVYIELSEDRLVKMVVGQTLSEIVGELPQSVIDSVRERGAITGV